jgi:UDPglucose 6-dehydrogenase
MNITVFGAGYVGMSISALLSQKNNVSIVDTDIDKINKINSNQSTIKEELISEYLLKEETTLKAYTSISDLDKDQDMFILCLPTDYDPINDCFDVNILEEVISNILNMQHSHEAPIIIKSTIPIGFTSQINQSFNTSRVVFSPEFLREGSSLHDNLYPSRIICGTDGFPCNKYLDVMRDSSLKKDVPILLMDSKSAEAVKLFANTYLAMRIGFFNELDTFSLINNLDTKKIIQGVSLDERVGDYYNNPSFGFGGYCLPKDTKQLLSNFREVPQAIIEATISSNTIRQDFISNQIIKIAPKILGVYRLAMKMGSDNYRSSSIQRIMHRFSEALPGSEILIYEPMIESDNFEGFTVCNDLQKFKNDSVIILANRNDDLLFDVNDKVYTRDIFNQN